MATPHIPNWTTAELIHEYAAKLARVIYDQQRSTRTAAEPDARMKELRGLLMKDAESSEMCRTVVDGMDHIFRVLFGPKGALFSVSYCDGKDVDYFRVAVVEDGEIRHDSGKLRNPKQATELAERWFFLVAPMGTSVVLLAALSNGQIIRCGERKVSAKP